MRTDYLPSLRTRSSQLLCGHCDCCYYAPDTDSCDYLLVEYKPRGCPPTPDCPRYAPAGALRHTRGEALAVRVQAWCDMGWSPLRIARRLHMSVPAVRLLRARRARGKQRPDNP